MAVEIGSLVVRGTFGQASSGDAPSAEELRAEMMRLRRDLLREVREMLAEADRHARER